MESKLFVDSLGIKGLLMLANKVFAHISLEDGLKHRVHELLLLSKQSLGVRRSRTILWVKDLFTTMCSGSRNGSLLPCIPLFIILEHSVMGLITFDPLLEFISRGESR